MTASLLSSLAVTCTFITRQVVADVFDADGNDTFTDVPVLVAGCLFAPGGGSETLGNQDTVVDTPTLYAPTGSPVPAVIDAVVVPGFGTYEVDGSPSVWASNQTGYSIVIKLRQVNG